MGPSTHEAQVFDLIVGTIRKGNTPLSADPLQFLIAAVYRRDGCSEPLILYSVIGAICKSTFDPPFGTHPFHLIIYPVCLRHCDARPSIVEGKCCCES